MTTDEKKIKRREVEVSTVEYEFAHGRNPRGYGSWAFAFRRGENDLNQLFWVNGATYRDAKKAAITEAIRRGSYEVHVCS